MTEKELFQLITSPETDNDRVLRLATEHNTDLPGWCARRRRHHRLMTDAIIVSSIAALVIITTLPDPDGHYVSSAQARAATINTIEQTTLIAKL